MGCIVLLYYSIPDVIRAYAISRSTLKNKIDTGEIHAERQSTSVSNKKMFKYIIPESELVKLEYCKKCEIVARETSQPNYYVDNYRKEQERRLSHDLMKAERTKRARIVEKYKEYLQSDKWQEVRRERFQIDGYQCQICGTAKNLDVHHVSYEHLGQPEEINDLVTLCRKCHFKIVHEHDTCADLRKEHENGTLNDALF